MWLTAALDTKQATIDNTNRLDAASIADGSVENTEFQYLNGVTSAIQTQLDNKQAIGSYLTQTSGDIDTVTIANNLVVTISSSTLTRSPLHSMR
eukprot:2622778-Prymnesium_polylepis.1